MAGVVQGDEEEDNERRGANDDSGGQGVEPQLRGAFQGPGELAQSIPRPRGVRDTARDEGESEAQQCSRAQPGWTESERWSKGERDVTVGS